MLAWPGLENTGTGTGMGGKMHHALKSSFIYSLALHHSADELVVVVLLLRSQVPEANDGTVESRAGADAADTRADTGAQVGQRATKGQIVDFMRSGLGGRGYGETQQIECCP